MWHGHLARGIFRHGLEARATPGDEIRSTNYFAAPKASKAIAYRSILHRLVLRLGDGLESRFDLGSRNRSVVEAVPRFLL